MKNICGQYISIAKSFFPIMGKAERQYMKSLKTDIEECCAEENISSLEQLYDKYGMPHDVANNYFTMLDVDAIARKTRYGKRVKITALAMLFIILCGVFVWGTTYYNIYRILTKQNSSF